MESDDSPVQVVCDAGPLIHLDELDSLDLLADFVRVVVPGAVREEVERHRPGWMGRITFTIVLEEAEVAVSPELRVLIRALSLGTGEQAALAAMTVYEDAVFLSDDAGARLAAKALGYPSQGSLGVILRALRRQQRTRSEVLLLLREIPTRSTLHIRPGLLQEIIEGVEAAGA